MMIRALEGHTKIGWDFDGTLVDHRMSVRMHAFIRAFPQFEHHIITFRTHGMQDAVWDDLRAYASAPEPEVFVGLHNIEDARYLSYQSDSYARQKGVIRGKPTPDERYYTEWKGLKCKELGLTILVDDMKALVLPGCEKHGIAYLHPNDLLR